MKYALRLYDPDLPENAPAVFETTFNAASMLAAVQTANRFKEGKASLSRLVVGVKRVDEPREARGS